MLVLSRRTNEKIVFPSLGITVSVESIDSNRVRIGIDAPPEIPVLRDELVSADTNTRTRSRDTAYHKRNHELRNRLNAMAVGLHLLQRQLDLGMLSDGNKAISETLRELQEMNDLLGSTSTPKTKTSPVQNLRALVVDDNKNEAELLAGYLRTYGYDVFTANNGTECLDFLTSHTRPDVILLDMNMPQMDGKAAIRRIRENPAHDGIKVFAVSGLSQETACIETGPQGVDRWFTKPIQPDELVKELQRELSAPPV
jgi:carbon storage regulator CsrA